MKAPHSTLAALSSNGADERCYYAMKQKKEKK
jgi:hypothetical protein